MGDMGVWRCVEVCGGVWSGGEGGGHNGGAAASSAADWHPTQAIAKGVAMTTVRHARLALHQCNPLITQVIHVQKQKGNAHHALQLGVETPGA